MSSSSTNSSGDILFNGGSIKWLTDHLSALYKKNLLQKPSKYVRSSSMENHIDELNKYFKTVNLQDDLGKICILLESLDQSTKDELLFEDNYKANSSSYQWHTDTLCKLTLEKHSKTLDLSKLFKLRQNSTSFQEFLL